LILTLPDVNYLAGKHLRQLAFPFLSGHVEQFALGSARGKSSGLPDFLHRPREPVLPFPHPIAVVAQGDVHILVAENLLHILNRHAPLQEIKASVSRKRCGLAVRILANFESLRSDRRALPVAVSRSQPSEAK
jgi:hypothetical protein